MDTSDPYIVFDENGICNHCLHYDSLMSSEVHSGDEGSEKLLALVNKIKKDGHGKEYDSIIGLSGGVDSSYVAWLVKDLGLRPLAVHLDNGWNSELAVQNVENIVTKLNLDLFTIVIDWAEFRDLQIAYLKASVIDLEVTSDHAIVATMYKLAKDRHIGYILNGTNIVTESILPHAWYYKHKMDFTNLKDIYRQFGSGRKLKTYPMISFFTNIYYTFFLNLKWVSILNYVSYNKEEAMELIARELGWRNYGGKHHESVITKFYQSYILPTKTGFDKRRAHLSNLICSNQITRDKALKDISEPVYKSKQELEQEIDYVLKKLELSKVEFEEIMTSPPRRHEEFKTNATFRLWMNRIKQIVINFRRISGN